MTRRAREFQRRSRALKHPASFANEFLRQRLWRRDDIWRLNDRRDGNDVCWAADDEDEPLVTVRIATYNRGPLVAERALASVISQTYERLEILVIGDHCDEATAAAVRGVDDPRIRFINLAERGQYPADPTQRWMVAGTTPMNAGLAVAQGKWIAPCDDDDEFTEDHVEILLNEVRSRRLEFVWSVAAWESQPNVWTEVGEPKFRHGGFSHGSVLYASALRFFRHNECSWKLGQPADYDLWLRMKRAGVRMGFVDTLTYRHYVEAAWRR